MKTSMMKSQRVIIHLSLCLLFLSSWQLYAQSLNGQWSGSFITHGDVWGGKTEYIMELDIKDNQVNGYSYTYFVIAGKRHYIICRLEGEYESQSRSLSVKEVEKVKSNTPADFKDMFQMHRLTYFKQGDKESLEGKWKSTTPESSNQTGETVLERRMLAKIRPSDAQPSLTINKSSLGSKPSNKLASSEEAKKNPTQAEKSAGSTSLVKNSPTQKPQKPSNPAPRARSLELVTIPRTELPQRGNTKVNLEMQPRVSPNVNVMPKADLRPNKLLQIIELEQADFTVELYDNGSVDGDTVSLFFNNKLMVAHKKLSTVPIVLDLSLDRNQRDNELVMFAESLGDIPPNTALMVVKYRDKRYEVNITSTEQTNGAVRFRLKN